MGPYCKRITRKSSTTSRTLIKNGPKDSNLREKSPVKTPNDSSKLVDADMEMVCDVNNVLCSTPKAERFRIPQMNTCPKAPKKRRRILVASSCSLRRRSDSKTSISFVEAPDIEAFFNLAISGIIQV